MNKKIEELAKQCEVSGNDTDGYFTRFDKEKFALLIIIECANIADEGAKETIHVGDYVMTRMGYRCGDRP